MKKFFATALVFVLAFVFVACDNGDTVSIEGKWKSTGDQSWGQVQPGAIIIFDGTHCNFYSPQDTYAFIKPKNGDEYELDVTSLIGESKSYRVQIIDHNNIKIFVGSTTLILQRLS